jgi:ferric-dicitrate binding protein FerR (iron transport regulator)
MDDISGRSGHSGRFSAEDLQRIERFLASELTPAEADAFVQWAAIDPARGRLVAALTDLWTGDGPDVPAIDVDAMWARTLPRVRERRRVLSLIRRDESRSSSRTIWARVPAIAAAAVVVAAIGVAARITLSRAGRQEAMTPATMREFSTRRGQRADLRLDDGTQVVLGAATTVHIPDDYGDRTRDVYLDGEAYFVVRHDSAHPFAVHTGHAIVRDIGTRFVVTAYGHAMPTRIVVVEGEVTVAHVDLRRNDLAIVDSSGEAAAVRHGVNALSAIGWTQGRLALEATPFRDVVASLSRWYDLDIQLAGPTLGRQPLTVTFGSESTRQVLDALAMLTHTRYEQHGRTVTFYPLPGS